MVHCGITQSTKETYNICRQKECLLNNRLKFLIFFHRANTTAATTTIHAKQL